MVVINEVAWMGNAASPNAEWIELANTDIRPIDLTGWTLSAADGTPNIKLAGSIVGRGYFLLERTSDASVPEVAGDQIYTGALENEGETLTLRDAASTTIDQVTAGNGWPAGDNTSKKTAQRLPGQAGTGSGWITATPTPRAQNANPPPPPVPPPKPAPKLSPEPARSTIVQKVAVENKISPSAYEAKAVVAPTAATSVAAVGAAMPGRFSFTSVLVSPWTLGFIGVVIFSAAALLLL